MNDHLERTISDRGFANYPTIPDAYGTHPARVYESSAASEPMLWLALGQHDDPVAVHLTIDNAVRLAHQLLDAAMNHYQADDGEFRPSPEAKAAAADGDWEPALDEYFASRGVS